MKKHLSPSIVQTKFIYSNYSSDFRKILNTAVKEVQVEEKGKIINISHGSGFGGSKYHTSDIFSAIITYEVKCDERKEN